MRPTWFVTELADTAYCVQSEVGECFYGFRLQPGARIDAPRLLAALGAIENDGRPSAKGDVMGPDSALSALADFVQQDARVDDALHSLSVCPTVGAAALQLGVTERSLQRLVLAATARPPSYWRALARVRRAAAALQFSESLADCAAHHGFADQAHMTREFGRWLGTTPRAAMASAEILAAVQSSGYH